MAAKKNLESLNCSVSDTKLTEDVLLMHLHSSYDPVHITILVQKNEPSLEDIKSILTSSSASDIKTEAMEDVLATCVDRSKKADPIDDKGFRWSDINRDGVCHWCGHPGHIAARCMYSMPQSVKEWIMSSHAPSPSPAPPSPASQEHAGFAYVYDSDSGVGPCLI